jgi:hypothetical protein
MVESNHRDKKEMAVEGLGISAWYETYVDLVYVLKDLKIIPLPMAAKLEQAAWIESLRNIDER